MSISDKVLAEAWLKYHGGSYVDSRGGYSYVSAPEKLYFGVDVGKEGCATFVMDAEGRVFAVDNTASDLMENERFDRVKREVCDARSHRYSRDDTLKQALAEDAKNNADDAAGKTLSGAFARSAPLNAPRLGGRRAGLEE